MKLWKIVFLFCVALFLINNNVEATPGCCIAHYNEEWEYCARVVDSSFVSTQCVNGPRREDSLFDTNAWISISEKDQCDETASSGDYINLCVRGCSVTNGRGTNNILKIQHLNEGGGVGDFYPGSCRTENDAIDNPVACIFDNVECRWGYSRAQCILSGGRQSTSAENINDQGGCNSFTTSHKDVNKGCCVDTCRSGVLSGECSGNFIRGSLCAEVSQCQYRCSLNAPNCEHGGIIADNVIHSDNCGGETKEICTSEQYCSGGICMPIRDCTSADGTIIAGASQTWCSIPDEPNLPGESHYLMECTYAGKVRAHRCGLFRDEICGTDMTDNKIKCIPNNWRSCSGKTAQSSCEDQFCVWIGGKCLPRHPPGFMFWRCPEGVDCGSLTWSSTIVNGRFDNFMCSVTDAGEEGCWRSGDCIDSGDFSTTIPDGGDGSGAEAAKRREVRR